MAIPPIGYSLDQKQIDPEPPDHTPDNVSGYPLASFSDDIEHDSIIADPLVVEINDKLAALQGIASDTPPLEEIESVLTEYSYTLGFDEYDFDPEEKTDELLIFTIYGATVVNAVLSVSWGSESSVIMIVPSTEANVDEILVTRYGIEEDSITAYLDNGTTNSLEIDDPDALGLRTSFSSSGTIDVDESLNEFTLPQMKPGNRGWENFASEEEVIRRRKEKLKKLARHLTQKVLGKKK